MEAKKEEKEISLSRSSLMDEVEFSKWEEKLEEKLRILLSAFSKGHMNPLPKDKKICERCKWKKICRAPHLRI